MAEAPIYLVRHGKDGYDGNLTPEGIEQSEYARDTLLEVGLGTKALLLSSNAPRALQTAGIIGLGLDTLVHPSQRINTAGSKARIVQNLDTYLEETLRRLGLTMSDGQSLVVVTHAPLIAVAKGLDIFDSGQVMNGEVVEYEPGSWTDLYYDESYETIYGDELNGDGI